MNTWFTVEQVDSQTFAISEYKHWEETHCYLLCGRNGIFYLCSGLCLAGICRHADFLVYTKKAIIDVF